MPSYPDRVYLDLAARLAIRAAGDVEPNPLVGAVIVKDGRVIGMGHHRRYGGPHAEREALEDCRRRGEDPRGSTVYVTLEPCRHHGKTPPCTDALIEAGVGEVVFARPDPGADSGGGGEVCRRAGMRVRLSEESALATRISDPFVKRVRRGLPWVIAKWAQTVDGRVATRTGESQWISNEWSRKRVHRLRARVDGVITGLGTATVDDPMLNARGVRRVRRPAARILIDTDLEVPLDSKLVRTAAEIPTFVACSVGMAASEYTAARRAKLEAAGVRILSTPAEGMYQTRLDLEHLLRRLAGEFRMTNLLVEAGPGLLGNLFERGLVDEAVVYVAPMLIGDELAKSAATGRIVSTLSAGKAMELVRVKRLHSDVELTYRSI